MSLRRQIWVVLRSYLTRPGFRWTALMMVIGYTLLTGMESLRKEVKWKYGEAAGDHDLILLTTLFARALIFSGGLGIFAVFFAHARGQLMGQFARLLPQSRTANLPVAGGLLVCICAFFAWPPSRGSESLIGVFLVILGFAILIALAVLRPSLIPLPLIVFITIVRSRRLQLMLDQATLQNSLIFRTHTRQFEFNAWMIRALILVLDIAGLILLAKSARPRSVRSNRLDGLRRFFSRSAERPTAAISQRPHRFIQSGFARKLHRRVGAHDWRAAGVAAGATGALSLWFGLQFESTTAASMLTLLLALLPGGMVALGWPARWGSFDLESLYPASRAQFVTDLAASVIFDAVEFWITSAAAALGVLLCLHFPALREPRFWAAILAGAMDQWLWLGAIFFIGQRRQTLSYFLGLAPFATAMFMTLEGLWRRSDPVSPRVVVTAAAVQMGVGLTLFLVTWAFLQRGPRPAPSVAT